MRILTGTVVSVAMKHTVVVRVAWRVAHPMYKRLITKITRIKAHNENEGIKAGDTVRLEECRPISKTKHFKVVEVVK